MIEITLVSGTDENHVFTLTVTDYQRVASEDTVKVTITANAPSVADAGPDQTVASGATVVVLQIVTEPFVVIIGIAEGL